MAPDSQGWRCPGRQAPAAAQGLHPRPGRPRPARGPVARHRPGAPAQQRLPCVTGAARASCAIGAASTGGATGTASPTGGGAATLAASGAAGAQELAVARHSRPSSPGRRPGQQRRPEAAPRRRYRPVVRPRSPVPGQRILDDRRCGALQRLLNVGRRGGDLLRNLQARHARARRRCWVSRRDGHGVEHACCHNDGNTKAIYVPRHGLPRFSVVDVRTGPNLLPRQTISSGYGTVAKESTPVMHTVKVSYPGAKIKTCRDTTSSVTSTDAPPS